MSKDVIVGFLLALSCGSGYLTQYVLDGWYYAAGMAMSFGVLVFGITVLFEMPDEC